MAIFSRPKLALRVPSFHIGAVPRASVQALLARARVDLGRAVAATLSPTRWWARITSVPGVALLLGFSLVMLIAGLIVTWPRR